MNALAGKRVLVVEDDFLIAQMLVEILGSEDAIVIGPASTLERGMLLARSESIDAAVLDVNLRDLRSDDIADELQRRAIPFIIATGYGEQPRLPGVPVVAKPYTIERLLSALEKVLEVGARSRHTASK
jgi:DNA-binding NtrC family response regulator